MATTSSSGAPEAGHGVLGRLRRPTPVSAGVSSPDLVDPTTGLANRAQLHEWVAAAVEHSKARSNLAVVAFVDIGLLRDVNDAFGVDAGDFLLRAVGARLSSIDVPNTRVVRYGGAEFAVVFEQIANVDMAAEIGQFLLELLTPGFELGSEEFIITPTVGLAVSADNYANVRDLVRDAHRALIRARDGGPGSYWVHDESKRGRYETRIDENRLATAIERNEFLLAYQPIVRLDTGDTIGFEALLRWQSPSATSTGLLFPHDFLPLLEKTGMSVRLGHWVIHEACRQAGEWNRRFPDRPALFITCNVGARQLASVDFLPAVLRAIEESGVQPWQLCLDITEDALRFNRAGAWSTLRELKNRSVKLGLDDFGTGVSSLTYLREFKLDLLRVDRTFVTDLVLNREDRAIVKHITGLAHDLGLVAIAEGVENPEQAGVLRGLGVDLAQGFHFGRPAFAPETTVRLDPEAAPPDWSEAKVTTFKRDW